MIIIFPSNSTKPRQPDDDYRAEWDAANEIGLRTAVADHDEVSRGNIARGLRFLPDTAGDPILAYRGWMMRAEEYTALWDALRKRGFEPITSPDAYRTCHHLPENYPLKGLFYP